MAASPTFSQPLLLVSPTVAARVKTLAALTPGPCPAATPTPDSLPREAMATAIGFEKREGSYLFLDG